jgi:hypothetical protein
MTSDRRIAANRANAKNSTGPKSEDGKRRVSQNARRHGLTQATEPGRVLHHLSIILNDPRLHALPLSPEGHALAMSLADAEARLERVRAAEFRLLEDCLALGRERAHLESRWEEITTTHMISKEWRFDEHGVPFEATRKTKPQIKSRKEKSKVIPYGSEMRRLLRYRKQAENGRHRALKAWIHHLRQHVNSKTKPMLAAHAS